MKNTRKVYKIIAKGDGGKYIRMPQASEGYYIRKVEEDGVVNFTPLDLDERVRPSKEKKKPQKKKQVKETPAETKPEE